MKKILFAMGAAMTAVIGASPASATIYTYTRTDGIKFTIDTVAQTGRLFGTAVMGSADVASIDLNFSGADLAKFTNTSSAFNVTLTSLTGSVTNTGGIVFTAKTGGVKSVTLAPTLGFFNVFVDGVSWANNDPTNKYTSFATGGLTSVIEPIAVPEPAMLGLFGAGAVMVMMGRRRRSLGKAGAGMAQGAPRFAMA